jgi:hypothetical protein
MHRFSLPVTLALLTSCSPATPPAEQATGPAEPARTTAAPAPVATGAAPPATTATTGAELDPSRGDETGMVFEAYLSPFQEPDDEANTPTGTPKQFRSTTPSKTRAERAADGHRGHGRLRFSKDLSRVLIDVRIAGIQPETINMFHIHCGKPGILGPILVDFAVATKLQENIADGMFSVEIRNEHIVGTTHEGHGLTGAFTMGCVIPSPTLLAGKPPKVSTVAGMAQLARDGELYFNLHTTGHTYFGDIRGQIHAVSAQ